MESTAKWKVLPNARTNKWGYKKMDGDTSRGGMASKAAWSVQVIMNHGVGGVKSRRGGVINQEAPWSSPRSILFKIRTTGLS